MDKNYILFKNNINNKLEITNHESDICVRYYTTLKYSFKNMIILFTVICLIMLIIVSNFYKLNPIFLLSFSLLLILIFSLIYIDNKNKYLLMYKNSI
jgi:hypothetical protein